MYIVQNMKEATVAKTALDQCTIYNRQHQRTCVNLKDTKIHKTTVCGIRMCTGFFSTVRYNNAYTMLIIYRVKCIKVVQFITPKNIGYTEDKACSKTTPSITELLINALD